MSELKIHNCHTTSTIFNTKDYVLHEDHLKMVESLTAKVEALEKLAEERAQFINNGVEFGYITLPEFKGDSALTTYNRCQFTTDGAIIDINKGNKHE